jgi:hypothetical protein
MCAHRDAIGVRATCMTRHAAVDLARHRPPRNGDRTCIKATDRAACVNRSVTLREARTVRRVGRR